MSSSPEDSSSPTSRVRSIPELMELIRHAFRDSDFAAIESSIRALHREPDATSPLKPREELYLARIGELSEELRQRENLCERYVELSASYAELQKSSRSRIEDLETELERKREAHEELSKEKEEIREAYEAAKASCVELEREKMAVEEEVRELRRRCEEMEATKEGEVYGTDGVTMCSPKKEVLEEGRMVPKPGGDDTIAISDDSEEEEIRSNGVMRKEWMRFFSKSRAKR